MSTVWRVSVPAIAAGLLLAGCGSGSSGTTASPLSSATAQPTSPAAQPSPTGGTDTATASPSSSGTGSSSSASTGSTKPHGWNLVPDKPDGFQFAVPAGYFRITSKSQLTHIFKAGAASIERSGITQQLLNKQVRVLAIKYGTTDSLNVVVTPADGLTPDLLPQAEPALKSQVTKLGAGKVAFKKATIDGVPALRAHYTIHLQGRSVLTIQYITVQGDKAYTLTLSQTDQVAPKFEKQLVGSWRFAQHDD